MKKFVIVFSFVLLTFSLTKCAKQDTNMDSKTKNIQMKRESDMKTKPDDDQENINTVDLMTIMTECNDSFRIEMSYIQALNESGSFPDETDKTPKCFFRCVLESTRVASEEGEYDPAQASAVFGWGMDVETLASSCANRDESCKCERAYQFMKCLMEKEIEQSEKSQ